MGGRKKGERRWGRGKASRQALTIAEIMISTVSSSRMFTQWVRPRMWQGIICLIEMHIFR